MNYELTLPDGRVLLTRISHPVNRETYGPSIWSHILREQLEGVREGLLEMCERKGSPKPWSKAPGGTAVGDPLGVVSALVEQFHVPETEVRTMTRRTRSVGCRCSATRSSKRYFAISTTPMKNCLGPRLASATDCVDHLQ